MRISDWSSDVCSSDLAREGGLVARHLLGIAALQPFGGKLDRGQRVLDLMRDTPRHVGPGGAALVGKLLRDVVEGQDVARRVLRNLDRQRPHIAMGDRKSTRLNSSH